MSTPEFTRWVREQLAVSHPEPRDPNYILQVVEVIETTTGKPCVHPILFKPKQAA